MKIKISCALLLASLLTPFYLYAQENKKENDEPVTKTSRAASSKAGAVATVNGITIPKSRLDAIMRERASIGQPDTEDARKQALDELINREILVQEANRKGFSKKSDIQEQMKLAQQAVLVRAVLQDIVKTRPITDESLKSEYEKIKTQMGDKEYKARHILVEKESEAKDIIAQLKKGSKFEELAAKSKDPGSKEKGGDLGWNVPANYVKPFADAMQKLSKGQYTQEPVQSQFGWHVILLEDSRPTKAPSFEEVKSHLLQRFQEQTLQQGIAELRSKAKVQVN